MSDETLVKSLRTPQWRAPHNTPTVSRLNEQAADEIERLTAALAAETARADRAETALAHVRQQASIWAQEARTQGSTVRDVGVALGGIPDYGPIVAEVAALRTENAKLRAWLTAANSHHREMSDK